MNSELVIYHDQTQLCCVLLEQGRPADLLRGNPNTPHRQDIYLGKVTRVTPALDCAFVDIGDSHDAMLNLSEAPADIKTGQPIVIQVRRVTDEGKGVQVTTRISLPGPYAVHNPAGRPKKRSRLNAFPDDAARSLFETDLARLTALWQETVEKSKSGAVPRCLLPLGEPLHAALISLIQPGLSRILIEGDALFARVYDLVKTLMPPSLPLLALHVPAAGYGLASALGLANLIESLGQRRVWLDNGGYLVIDRTEALTVIDVNSGKDVRGGENQDLRLRTNQQAAREIARQLRLRNIGGIIIVDFLNLPDEASQTELTSYLTGELANDRASVRIVGFTGLGLLEMTRTAL